MARAAGVEAGGWAGPDTAEVRGVEADSAEGAVVAGLGVLAGDRLAEAARAEAGEDARVEES